MTNRRPRIGVIDDYTREPTMIEISDDDRHDVELNAILAHPYNPARQDCGLTAIASMAGLRLIPAHVPVDEVLIATIVRLRTMETRQVVSSLNFWFPSRHADDVRAALRMTLRMRIPLAANITHTGSATGQIVRRMAREIVS